MRRRAFHIVPPVREIADEDGMCVFDSHMLDACGMTLSDMCGMNYGGKHVWIYDMGFAIGSVVLFYDRGDSIHLSVISNNFSLPRSVLRDERPGLSLYLELEAAARLAGVARITLESVPDRVAYWRSRGFRESEPARWGGFCMLQPMEKAL